MMSVASKARAKERAERRVKYWIKNGGVIAPQEYIQFDSYGDPDVFKTPELKLTQATMEALDRLRSEIINGWSGGCIHYVEDEGCMDVPTIRHLQRLGVLTVAELKGFDICHYDRDREQCQRAVFDSKVIAVARTYDERNIAQWSTPEAHAQNIDDMLRLYRENVIPKPTPEHLALWNPVGDMLKETQTPPYVTILDLDGTIGGYALNREPYQRGIGFDIVKRLLARHQGMSTVNYAKAEAAFNKMGARRHAYLVSGAWLVEQLGQHSADMEWKSFHDAILLGDPVQVQDHFKRGVHGYGASWDWGTTFQWVDFAPADGWSQYAKQPQAVYEGYFKRMRPVYLGWADKPNVHPDTDPIYYWTGH